MKVKILVIDDEPDITFILEGMLSKEGYAVDTAGGSAEAKTKIAQNDYDLILADIVLGSETGVDILREVKMKKLNSLVIFMTGYPTFDTAAEAIRLGVFDYLPKPIEKERLIRTVKKALQSKGLVD